MTDAMVIELFRAFLYAFIGGVTGYVLALVTRRRR